MTRDGIATLDRRSRQALSILGLLVVLVTCGLTAPPNRLIWVVAMAGILPLLLATVTGNGDALRPSVLVPFTYAIYAIGPCLVRTGYASETIATYGAVHAVGMMSLYSGLVLGEGRGCEQRGLVRMTSIDVGALRLAIIVLFVLGAVSAASQIAAFGGLSGLLSTGYGGAHFDVLRSAATFGAGFSWWMLACGLLWFLGVATNRNIAKFLAIMFALPVLAILLKIGDRSTIVYVALFFFVMAHESRKMVSPRAIAVALICGMLMAQFYSLARYYLNSGLWASVRETVQTVVRAPVVILPTSSNEFRAPSAALLDVLEYSAPVRVWGKTYVEAIISAVPGMARIAGIEDSNPSLWRIEEYYPQILAAGGGLGFSPAAEGWMNFGLAGVIGHLLIYGVIVGSIYRRFKLSGSMVALLALAAAMPMFALDGLRIHSGAFLYKASRGYFMPLFAYLVARDLLRVVRTRFATARSTGVE